MKKIIAIPAAGRGSRLGSELPKIFTPIYNGLSIYDYLLLNGLSHLDELVLLLSPSGAEFFNKKYKDNSPNKVKLLIQEEPTGMLDAINIIVTHLIERNTEDFKLIIQWGDQPFCDKELHHLLFQDLNYSLVSVPLVWVNNPYVQFCFKDKLYVLESREGDLCDSFGFKDMGIFAFKRKVLQSCWDDYLKYAMFGAITGEKNFVKFLMIVHDSFNISWRLDQPNYKSLGINTSDELVQVRRLFEAIGNLNINKQK